jgi:hypothetical protein
MNASISVHACNHGFSGTLEHGQRTIGVINRANKAYRKEKWLEIVDQHTQYPSRSSSAGMRVRSVEQGSHCCTAAIPRSMARLSCQSPFMYLPICRLPPASHPLSNVLFIYLTL